MTSGTLAPFEAEILEELLDAQRQLHAIPPPARPTVRRRVAATVTVAAALGAGTAVVVATRPTSQPAARPGPKGSRVAAPIDVQTVASITRRATAALAKIDNLVLHTRETSIRSTAAGTVTEVTDSWLDRGDPEHSRSMLTENGQPIADGQMDSASPNERSVDYLKRTWYEGPRIDFSHRHLLGFTPDWIRQQLEGGGVTLVGHETINGRDTLHLARHDIPPFPGDLWVDASTYLVVRTTGVTGTTDFEWMPRTEAARAQLLPVIPPGFAFGGVPPDTAPNPDGSRG